MDTVTLDASEYRDLIDARDHAIAMRAVANATLPTLTEDEVKRYLEASSPLAFWRKHRGHSQAALARRVKISQPYLAQIEAGRRVGDVMLYAKIAKVLQVRIEDLIAD
jgi:DNA-binding XRE family transcriptional regulator